MEHEIQFLRDKVLALELENERLKRELQEHKVEWVHPESGYKPSKKWKVNS